MPLISPRFKDNAVLAKVENKLQMLSAGSSGVHVHLIQMGLLDLGFALPRSTGSQHFSPDGIFGSETTNAVKAFQRTVPGLKDDGVVGQLTMRALDEKLKDFTHEVKLHFRSIAMTNVPFEVSLRNAERVFAQYAIKISFASGESLMLSDEETQLFNQIDQECDWDLDAGEFEQVQSLGSRAPNTDVLVFHVSRFADGNVLGCGGHKAGRPACTITASALGWDTAHEVCHVLLGSGFRPVHATDRRNLMHEISRTASSTPQLTEKQIARIRASDQCKAL
jgi:hypothetical protein